MNETERDPLDVAADEAVEIMTDKQNLSMGWGEYVAALGKAAEKSQRKHHLALRLQQAFSAGEQLPLFPGVAVAVSEPRRPRARSRRMMHAGELAGSFMCPACLDTAPVPDGITDSARKRGVPCQRCNGLESRQDAPGIAPDENATSVPS